jgi:hypothetical protein
MKTDLSKVLGDKYKLDAPTIQLFINFTSEAEAVQNKTSLSGIRRALAVQKIPSEERKTIIKMVKNERSLSRKINRLLTMQKMFKYWHVIHLPFALVMLVIVIIHVAVTLAFGYKWIF